MSDDKKHDPATGKLTKKELAAVLAKAMRNLDHAVKHRISIADAEAIAEAVRAEFAKRGLLEDD